MDFLGYKYIATLLVLAEIPVFLLAYKRNPKLAIYAVLLSIALKGQYLWFGRAIYAWHIAALFGLAYLAARQAHGATLRSGRALGFFRMSMLLYFIYTISVSIPMWHVFSAEGLGDVGTQVSMSRIITQTLYFLLVVGLYGLGIWAGHHVTTFGLLKAIIMIAVVAAYGAILQTLIVNFFGINIFPIIGSDDTIRSAYIRGTTFRANSFVGEPKHLGLLMSMGLTSYFITRLFRISVSGLFGFHKPLVMIVALMLSLSTTGLGVTAVGVVTLALLLFKRLRVTDFAAAGLLALVLLTQVIGADNDFSNALESQTSKNGFEIQDQSVWEGLQANPSLLLTGTGLGNIHLFAVDYLPSNFPLFRDRGYKANSGLFFVMGDSGLIGLLLLLSGPIFAFKVYRQLRGHLRTEQRSEAFAAIALISISFISFMLRYDVAYFLFSGVVLTRLVLLRSQALSIDRTDGPQPSAGGLTAASVSGMPHDP